MFPLCCKSLFYCFVILQPDHDDGDAADADDADADANDDDDDVHVDDDDVYDDIEEYERDTDVLAMAWLTTPCLSAYCLGKEIFRGKHSGTGDI